MMTITVSNSVLTNENDHSPFLILKGPIYSGTDGAKSPGKSQRLIERIIELTRQADHKTSRLLVLCCNSPRQKELTAQLLQQHQTPNAQWPVYTFLGFVRNSLFDCWPLVEEKLQQSGLTQINRLRPILSGLEESEVLLKQLINNYVAQHPSAFDDFTGTDHGVMKQIIRRFRLRAENRLTREEMSKRSILINEVCQQHVSVLERQFDQLSYKLRILDNNKQQEVFHSLLESSEPFQTYVKTKVQHLVVDDLDEATPSQQKFIQWLIPNLQTLTLSYDPEGGSRRGYLNAYPEGVEWFKQRQLASGESAVVEVIENQPPLAENAQRLLNNWRLPLNNQLLSNAIQLITPYPTRLEMMDGLLELVKGKLQQGEHPGTFIIVMPTNDKLATHLLQSRLKRCGVKTQVLNGTQRPVDHPLSRAFLLALQWKNAEKWEQSLSLIDIKTILVCLLQLDRLDQHHINDLSLNLYEFITNRQPADLLIPEASPITLSPMGEAAYQRLEQWLNHMKCRDFEDQLYRAFDYLITPLAKEKIDKNQTQPIKRIIDSYFKQKAITQGLNTLNAKETADTTPQNVPKNFNDTLNQDFEKQWIQQVKTGVVADMPDAPMVIDPDAIVIGTPQKVIDFSLQRKVQYWLDISSPEWHRSDNAPLYNAWVHSPQFDLSRIPNEVLDNNVFESFFEKHLQPGLIRQRAGHITRTLMMLASNSIIALSSELDDSGEPQLGLLKKMLMTEPPPIDANQPIERAVLRDDQQAILDYRSGTMAITAVPGAGKTFVNVELILELITQGIPPEKILVLTYMDSAAKTLLSRLRNKLSAITAQLPIVSTIHSLAYRIVIENAHRLELSSTDITVLDDFSQDEILVAIAQETLPEQQRLGGWINLIKKGIGHAKTEQLTPQDLKTAVKNDPSQFKVRNFLPAYEKYINILRENNQLDFTDLIISAVDLLEKFPDVRQQYQQQFDIIIEDEAQDSSWLLQRLISLLGGDNLNLIRTGDTNQSITTTFSSAETAVFRQFIKQADHVVTMNKSGRCCKQAMTLANLWIEKATAIPELQNAFEPVNMHAVEGFNPPQLLPFEAQLFPTEDDENRWIVGHIQQLKQHYPDKTIAILPFSNGQVQSITSDLQQSGIPAISFSEKVNVHPVFSMLLTYLKMLVDPLNTDWQQRLIEQFITAQIIEPDEELTLSIGEKPLIQLTTDKLQHPLLKQIYYDLWEDSRSILGGQLAPLMLKFIERWFQQVDARSNGYLCVIQINLWLSNIPETTLSPIEWLILKMEDVERSGQLGKSFGSPQDNLSAEFVQVMTLHKSKGQEFDLVFMPYMTQSKFRITEDDKLLQAFKQIKQPDLDLKSDSDKRITAQVEERARLIYVGLTRAKQGLFLSAHQQRLNRYHRPEKTEPSLAFKILSDLMATLPQEAEKQSELSPNDEDLAHV